jgi:hypothetical protein
MINVLIENIWPEFFPGMKIRREKRQSCHLFGYLRSNESLMENNTPKIEDLQRRLVDANTLLCELVAKLQPIRIIIVETQHPSARMLPSRLLCVVFHP